VGSRDPAKHLHYIKLCTDKKTLDTYQNAAAMDPMAAWEMAKGSCSTYSTTLHVIKSVLLRLGKLMTACKLYRGLSGMAPPPTCVQPPSSQLSDAASKLSLRPPLGAPLPPRAPP
jgi:hypothetical protein